MIRIIVSIITSLIVFSCSSESEKPVIDIKLPLITHDLIKLSEDLRIFGNDNNLLVLENDRDQMSVLNGGEPAVSFWFSSSENKTAITVNTINQSGFMRVMMFSNGFNSTEQMEYIKNRFLGQFTSIEKNKE